MTGERTSISLPSPRRGSLAGECGRFVQYGWLTIDSYDGTFRVGVAAGRPGYVALMCGPFAISVGRRRSTAAYMRQWHLTSTGGNA